MRDKEREDLHVKKKKEMRENVCKRAKAREKKKVSERQYLMDGRGSEERRLESETD